MKSERFSTVCVQPCNDVASSLDATNGLGRPIVDWCSRRMGPIQREVIRASQRYPVNGIVSARMYRQLDDDYGLADPEYNEWLIAMSPKKIWKHCRSSSK